MAILSTSRGILSGRGSEESKRWAANCWRTSGNDKITNSCHESEIKRSRFPERLRYQVDDGAVCGGRAEGKTPLETAARHPR